MLKLSVQFVLSATSALFFVLSLAGGVVVKKTSLLVREVKGSILSLVKSNIASPTAQHCCDGSSQFNAVLPRQSVTEMDPRYSLFTST